MSTIFFCCRLTCFMGFQRPSAGGLERSATVTRYGKGCSKKKISSSWQSLLRPKVEGVFTLKLQKNRQQSKFLHQQSLKLQDQCNSGQTIDELWEAIYGWDIKQTTLYIFVYCLYGYWVNGTWGQGCSLVVSNHSLDRAERLKQQTVCFCIVL